MDTPDDVRERAVREYLMYLADPEQLVDPERVAELQRRADVTVDVLDRLKAFSDLDRARNPNEAHYGTAFIKHAKAWADQNAVSAGAFEQMHVPRAVLADAGLVPTRAKRTTHPRARSSVTTEQVKSAIRTLAGSFTSSDVADAAGGGSPMTIRRAINDLIDEGAIRRVGPHPDWQQRGRAPIVYETTA